MKVFFVNTTREIVRRHSEVGVKNFLVSYWYEKQSPIIDQIIQLVPDASIMLDSGAYTAMTAKEKINLDDYTQFCLDVQDKKQVKYIIALDDILDPEASKENYERFLDESIVSIPTFHYPESFDYLKYYSKKCDFIGIGGATNLKLDLRKLYNFYHHVFDIIPKGKKVHCFGISNWNLILQYANRITSTDSSGSSTRFNSLRALSLSGIPATIGIDTSKGRIPIDHIRVMQKYTIWRLLQMENEINEFAELEQVVKSIGKIKH